LGYYLRPPPIQKYVLEKPENILPLNSTLGIPGYFPHKGKDQDEEKMTLLNVVNGFQRPSLVNVSDPSKPTNLLYNNN